MFELEENFNSDHYDQPMNREGKTLTEASSASVTPESPEAPNLQEENMVSVAESSQTPSSSRPTLPFCDSPENRTKTPQTVARTENISSLPVPANNSDREKIRRESEPGKIKTGKKTILQ